jgi:hypothetical protein
MPRKVGRIRRNIHQSVIRRLEAMASMTGLCAIGFQEISGIQRRFGNKSEQALF